MFQIVFTDFEPVFWLKVKEALEIANKSIALLGEARPGLYMWQEVQYSMYGLTLKGLLTLWLLPSKVAAKKLHPYTISV